MGLDAVDRFFYVKGTAEINYAQANVVNLVAILGPASNTPEPSTFLLLVPVLAVGGLRRPRL